MRWQSQERRTAAESNRTVAVVQSMQRIFPAAQLNPEQRWAQECTHRGTLLAGCVLGPAQHLFVCHAGSVSDVEVVLVTKTMAQKYVADPAAIVHSCCTTVVLPLSSRK